MEENKKEDASDTGKRGNFITLHTPSGKPVLLQEEFIMSALGPGTNRSHTKLDVDFIGNVTVREALHEIPGNFAVISDMLINPKFFLAACPDNDAPDRYNVSFYSTASNKQYSYTTSISPEKMRTAIEKVMKKEPC